jgi:hypothetical protein
MSHLPLSCVQGKLDFLYTCVLINLLTASCGKYSIFITQIWIVPPKFQGWICSGRAANLTDGGGGDEFGRTGLPDTHHIEYTDGHTTCPNSANLPRCDRQAHHRNTNPTLWLRKPIREKCNVVFFSICVLGFMGSQSVQRGTEYCPTISGE